MRVAMKSTAAIAVAFGLLGAGPASAMIAPIINDGSTYTASADGEYVATYQGSFAGFTNFLYLVTDDGIDDNDVLLFGNGDAVGSTFSFGNLAAGTEFIFRLFVQTTANSFFSGDAASNPDNIVHAKIDFTTMPGVAILGFEDIFGGGDFDFDDLVITIANISDTPEVPIPGAAVLLLSGLAGAAGLRRLRKRVA